MILLKHLIFASTESEAKPFETSGRTQDRNSSASILGRGRIASSAGPARHEFDWRKPSVWSGNSREKQCQSGTDNGPHRCKSKTFSGLLWESNGPTTKFSLG
ncbi:MAG: hypothetical protein KF886_10140 [Candidatus Hydrogenedentes bacterium]|nr:hypothetical protein [Candidatus Hydrogenedentota bacterium]